MSRLSYWKILTRRKALTYGEESEKLGRILNTFDLTALGVGATLGVGVYVLAGHVSKDQAGPSVVLSFLIAAIASFLAGLCYAEFGARVPKSGSAYIYSYVCIGEFMAFIIGWNLMLEYIIGSASVSRGLSLYIDTLANDTMKIRFREIAPIEWDFMSSYFDFFGFSVAILLGIALAFGLKKSTMVNNLFTVLNIFIVLFVIIAGAIHADADNWNVNPANVSSMYNAGDGGFFPFGFEGTLRGAATCFFGFVGFDCIATTGEEVRNPQKAIPRAILFSLCTIFLAYFGVSTVLTLMWPYYKQDVNAPLPFAFDEIGLTFAKWVVAIGGIIGLVASLFGAMFPQPRIIYAMAQDGLIFRSLGEVSPRFKTPVLGTLCAALITGTMAGLFDLKALVNMLSIGTLMAYTVVAISILILRFSEYPDAAIPSSSKTMYESSNLLKPQQRVTGSAFMKQLFNISCLRIPSNISANVVGVLVTIYCLLALALSLTIYYAKEAMYDREPWALSLFGVVLGLLLLVLLLMSIQPRESAEAPFRVPWVPLLPGISIFVNIYLMLMLDVYTWVRFGIWMAIGFPIYFACVCFNKQEVLNVDVRLPSAPSSSNGALGGLDNVGYEQSAEDDMHRAVPTGPASYYEQNIDSVLNYGPKSNLIIAPAILPREEDELQTKAKSRTPSPKNSFDEIVPLSELPEGVTEKIEPNGKAYFVVDVNEKAEDTISDHPGSDQLTEEKETSRAIAFLDDILNDEEKTADGDTIGGESSLDDESLASPVFREQSVKADIHQVDVDIVAERKHSEVLVLETSVDQDDVVATVADVVPPTPIVIVEEPIVKAEEPKIKKRAIFIVGKDSAPVEEIANANHQAVDKEMFKTRLSTLLVNPMKLPQKKATPPMENAFNRPVTRSSSEPSFMLLLNKMSNSPTESDTDEVHDGTMGKPSIPPPPKFDETLYNTVRATNANDIVPVTPKVDVSSVPAAPKFDPVLFNTIGKGRSQRGTVLPSPASPQPSAPGYHEIPLRRLTSITPVAVAEVSNSPVDESPEPHSSPREAFKSKLEKILQQGPATAIRPRTFQPSTVAIDSQPTIAQQQPASSTDSGLSMASSSNSELAAVPTSEGFRDRARGFDTAKKKQKLIFDDVLKSINPETRPSVIRSSVEHRVSFRNFKEGLRKTAQPKQFLPHA